jgi:hypothetical protein
MAQGQERYTMTPQQIASAQAFNKGKIAPPLWPADTSSADFARITARFQRAKGLTVDGKFGKNTKAAYDANEAAPRPANYLIVDGVRREVSFPVITWEQDPFWSSYPGKNFRWRRSVSVEAFILHWDVTFSSKGTHTGLLDPARDASVHFLIDESGRIIQCLDAGFVAAWHAGSAGNINDRSCGVEINNRYYPKDNGAEGTKLRTVIKDLPVNGNLRAEYMDFHEEQKVAALQLSDALQQIFGYPRQVPKAPRYESDWTGDDKDPEGSVLRGMLDRDSVYEYQGTAGHFHFAEGKVDPGVAFLKRFVQAGY